MAVADGAHHANAAAYTNPLVRLRRFCARVCGHISLGALRTNQRATARTRRQTTPPVILRVQFGCGGEFHMHKRDKREWNVIPSCNVDDRQLRFPNNCVLAAITQFAAVASNSPIYWAGCAREPARPSHALPTGLKSAALSPEHRIGSQL